MTEHHVSDEDLVLAHYGELAPDARARLDTHVDACAACAERRARLSSDLSAVGTLEAMEPGPNFEARLWASLRPRLTIEASARARLRRRFFVPAAAAAALALAFLAGWLMRGGIGPAASRSVVAGDESRVRDRLVLVAVGEHLERTQMVLVGLLNTPTDSRSSAADRERAADLVATNRLYRQTVESAGEATLGALLDDLERVLVDVANAPPDDTPAEWARLRSRIESHGILFRTRVVSSELRARDVRRGPTLVPALQTSQGRDAF
ncbi:MAG: hypothetical protein U0Q12_22220 [Vicinamibacterales bacterium]